MALLTKLKKVYFANRILYNLIKKTIAAIYDLAFGSLQWLFSDNC